MGAEWMNSDEIVRTTRWNLERIAAGDPPLDSGVDALAYMRAAILDGADLVALITAAIGESDCACGSCGRTLGESHAVTCKSAGYRVMSADDPTSREIRNRYSGYKFTTAR